ncbi:MAG: phage portal protein, HK97 family [Candidatus Xenolissoclinum pacificiensis L6]|uniref:Phage portal protein, HK97 family n=1 Tax=Candidatus Xenolissoclinum pacificiensis L6 TaxID=1401685 RepID=W2V085_9RICK|nr:MAG: phage portal protein, HK97 family [Candidatus Xenolissoclinum pacificiensis L6]
MKISFSNKKNKYQKLSYKSTAYEQMYYSQPPLWSSDNYSGIACNGYMKNTIVYRSINMIATAISSIPIILYEFDYNQNKREISEHDILNLLSNPNPYTSYCNLMESIVSHLLLDGNAYLMRIGKPQIKEIYILRPDKISYTFNKAYNIPDKYIYNDNGKDIFFPIDPITGKSDILHFKTFNPYNQFKGCSAVIPAIYSIDQHNQANIWNQSMLRNSAKPCGALIVKGDKEGNFSSLSEDQYRRLKEQINSEYISSQNSGKPILLEGGLEWREMGLSHKDMDFLECKHSAARDISISLGVPPHLLGIPGDNTYNNVSEARMIFWEQTVIPLAHKIMDRLNQWLLPFFPGKLKIEYDKEQIASLTIKREKVWQYVEKASFMTINEKRQEFGLPPIKDGDRLP